MAMVEPRKPVAPLTATRPIATLSSGLLARKGDARPAMRRQSDFAQTAPDQDDLGWNDMGRQTPPPALDPVPPVLRERERLEDSVVAPPATTQAEPTLPAPVAPILAAAGRRAFTLRLDPARHLRLRLASTLTGRSAQRLVTEALDRFLATMPELDEVASRLPAGDRQDA